MILCVKNADAVWVATCRLAAMPTVTNTVTVMSMSMVTVMNMAMNTRMNRHPARVGRP